MPSSEQQPKLKPNQVKALAALLAADRALTNAELVEPTGVKKPSDLMRKLAELGLVETDRSRRPQAHRLTEAGRRVARDAAETVPPKPGPPAPPAPESGLTPTQVLALVTLMAEARALSNDELKELAGFALTGRDNTELERQGLVETDRTQRPYAHQLTDKGWRVARELHTTRPPRAGGSSLRTLFTLLANVHRALDRFHMSHAEFFKQTGEAPAARVPIVAEAGDVEARIRSAYRDLARVSGDWVGLADVRERLADLDRATVDTALHSLRRQDGVRIIPVANTKALTSRDRVAALRIGDTDAHALAIGQT